MKVCVSGSCKLGKEMGELVKMLQNEQIEVKAPSCAFSDNLINENSPKDRAQAVFDYFNDIKEADILYVFSLDGEVGKSVCVEMGYAFSLEKDIISSVKLIDLALKPLVGKVLKPKELINYCKEAVNV